MFRTTLRFLWRNRFAAGINIFGLATGLASCILMYMFVGNELRFDQKHSKKDRIYRISSQMKVGGEEEKWSLSSFSLSPTLKHDFPDVEEAIRLMPVRKQTVWIGEKAFRFENNFMTDPEFFSIFDYEFIEGNPLTALKDNGSVVITEEVARTLFGRVRGNLGQTIRYSCLPYTVTGVVRQEKNASHLDFQTLLTIGSLPPTYEGQLKRDWFYMAQTNYVLLKEGTSKEKLQEHLDQIRDTYVIPWLRSENSEGQIRFHPQVLAGIHLDTEFPAGYSIQGNPDHIYIFSIIALVVLAIACFNYVNLTTATSSKRAKEIGIRKTAGASRNHLFRQFLMESYLITGIALGIGLILVAGLIPFFNQLTEKSLSFPATLEFAGILLVLLLLIGFSAGSYPAFYLSGLQPAHVLKGIRTPFSFANRLRKVLVFTQFFISVSFILGTIVVFSQMHFMRNRDLGFNKDQILVLTVPRADSSFSNRFEAVKAEIKKHPAILKVAGTSSLPGQFSGTLIHSIHAPGKRRMEKGIDIMMVSHEFLDIMDMKLAGGRNFSRNFRTDDSSSFILNESAVRTYGLQNPYECTLENGFGYRGKVIGVVRDFHYASLHQPVFPLVMMLDARVQGYLLVKIQAGKEKEARLHAETVWTRFSRKYPLESFFLDETFEKLYRKEEKMMQVFAYFSIISIILSGLGLYALVTFNLQQRIKEIGIRKVLGAGLWEIFLEIGRDFILLVGLASLLAIPLAGYGMHQWLQDFANRISMEWWMFILAVGSVFLIAIITLLARTIPAAKANPSVSLRTE